MISEKGREFQTEGKRRTETGIDQSGKEKSGVSRKKEDYK